MARTKPRKTQASDAPRKTKSATWPDGKRRCDWCPKNDPQYIKFHDESWGQPVIGDDRRLFEVLSMECLQPGLNLRVVLHKMDDFKSAFADFDPEHVAELSDEDVEDIVRDKNIDVIRNRRKLKSIVTNAKAFLKVQEEFGSFSDYLWSFVDFKQIKNHFRSVSQVPASTPLSDRIANDLKRRGFKFVGPVSIYSFLMAVGVVDNHLENCFIRTQAHDQPATLAAKRRLMSPPGRTSKKQKQS